MTSDLRPYPKYKNSGLPWFGAVPSHWELPRLGRVLCERGEVNVTGQVTKVLSVLRGRGVIPYEEKGNIGNKKSDDITRYKIVRPRDIVANCMNVIIGSVGISRHTGCLSPVYYVLRTRGNRDLPEYFDAVFKIAPFHQSLIRIGKGILAHRMRIPMELLKCELIPRPPLDEQVAIVRYLRNIERRIQQFIRNRRRLIELLNEQKQAIITHAVTRGLDPTAPLIPSGLDWLGDVPKHWDIRRLKFLVRNVNQQTTSKQPGDIYIAMENVESWTGRITLPDEEATFESQVKRFEPGDVLFGKLRPYLAKVARPTGAGVCVGEFLVLRVREGSLLPEYLEHLLRSKPVIDLVNSSTFGAKMPRADWEFIGSVRLAYPPTHEEQMAIVRHIQAETRVIQGAMDRASREIELIREYRTRLIADVVTGKVDVRHLAAELEDEPEPEEADLAPLETETDVEELDEVMEEAADVDD